MRPEIDPVEETENPKAAEGRLRFLTYGKNVYKIECHDPYGHWNIRTLKGVTPAVLAEQSFTTPTLAEREVEKYENASKGA